MNLFPYVRMEGVDFGILDLAAPWAARIAESRLHYLYVVKSGSCWFEAVGGNRPVQLSAGDIVAVTNNVAHAIGDPPGPHWNDAGRLAVRPLRQEPRPAPDGPGQTRLLVGWVPCHVDPLLRFLPTVVRIPAGDPHGDRVHHLTELAEHELIHQARESGSDAVVRRLSEIMVVEFVRFLSNRPAAESLAWNRGLVDPEIASTLARLHENPGAAWTVETLRKVAGLSRAAFEERFRRFASDSPKRYLAKIRMQRAIEEIEIGMRTIAQIAEDLGYGSVAAFHRAFKREVGLTPVDYRRSVIRTVQE